MNQFGLYSRQVASSYAVYIIDPDLHVCEVIGVHCRIEGFEVGFGASLHSFCEACAHRRPDIVIVSEAVGASGCADLIRSVRRQVPHAAIFFVVEDVLVETIVAAMKLGVAEVFSKPLSAEKLLEALRRQVAANTYLDRSSGRLAIRGFSSLTGRETEVLEAIANGDSNKEIGKRLGISPRTVEVHRARVIEKLGAKNTPDLLRIVFSEMVNSGSAATVRDDASLPRQPQEPQRPSEFGSRQAS